MSRGKLKWSGLQSKFYHYGYDDLRNLSTDISLTSTTRDHLEDCPIHPSDLLKNIPNCGINETCMLNNFVQNGSKLWCVLSQFKKHKLIIIYWAGNYLTLKFEENKIWKEICFSPGLQDDTLQSI